MNIYQKTAFGCLVVLGLVLVVQQEFGYGGIKLMTLTVLVVALLTLPVTWQIIFTIGQIIFHLISAIGHGVGTAGDVGVDWSEKRKFRLGRRSTVPDWDDPQLQTTAPSVSDKDELDVPEFLRGDAGLSILEPR